MIRDGRRGVAVWVAVGVAIAAAATCSRSIREGTGDGTITARVITAMVNDPEVGRFRFQVETFDGVVMLSGQVDSDAAASRAVTLVRAVDDVRDVRSTIRVVPSEPGAGFLDTRSSGLQPYNTPDAESLSSSSVYVLSSSKWRPAARCFCLVLS